MKHVSTVYAAATLLTLQFIFVAGAYEHDSTLEAQIIFAEIDFHPNNIDF